jgi:hypothetical protein
VAWCAGLLSFLEKRQKPEDNSRTPRRTPEQERKDAQAETVQVTHRGDEGILYSIFGIFFVSEYGVGCTNKFQTVSSKHFLETSQFVELSFGLAYCVSYG